ncbi:MAG: Hint domain-containing protein [Microthrixaceae bacterium]
MSSTRPVSRPLLGDVQPRLRALLVVLATLVAVIGLGASDASAGAAPDARNGVAAINPGLGTLVANQEPVSPGFVGVSGPVFDDEAVVSPVAPSRTPGVCLRSFSADTAVLFGDGTTTKPISELEPGDEVWATDPETGESGPRGVEAVWPHYDWLLEFDVDGGSVTTTEDHHFWNATDREWQETQHLDAGDLLLTPSGEQLAAGSLDWSTWHYDEAYDLTIEGVHSYYVDTGDSDVLVHNCNRTLWEITQGGTERTVRHGRFGTFSKSRSDGLWWSRDQAGHGGSVWKVFREEGDGLRWIHDADEYGDFVTGKHKSGTGQFIPWGQLNG